MTKEEEIFVNTLREDLKAARQLILSGTEVNRSLREQIQRLENELRNVRDQLKVMTRDWD